MWRLCGNQVFANMVLTDYSIRRSKFLNQEFDERVNLFLVVSITISGVILAGIQLVMSYKLASDGKYQFDKDQELLIEQNKLSFKTSVTGCIILLISLAFFFIYVKFIYKFDEVKVEIPYVPQPTSQPAEVHLQGA